jgi:hydroxymethylpyrimidine/phosphomethylpyrimidine kinase
VQGRVLIIAGSDSGGGAGIQADIKTVTALGGYAMTAVTAVTVQNTTGVSAIHDIPIDIVTAQAKAVLSDLGADCIKVGMLHTPEIIQAVAGVLSDIDGIPIVVDPVMVAKGGAALLADDSLAILRDQLLPLATVLTPNIPEAQELSGIDPESDPDGALDALAELGPKSVLLKGGHLSGEQVIDRLRLETGETLSYEIPRIDTVHTHGTGCTLASAVATGLAQGLSMVESVVRARAYVLEAIRTAPGLGQGHGPLNHGHTVKDF